jgi:hypothetical protein
MRLKNKHLYTCPFEVIILFVIAALLALTGCKTAGISSDGFEEIFDGKSLHGWEGDPVYWSVENGNLVGKVTPQTLLQHNSFIIWRGGTVADFILEVQYRITPDGNSGINYRSEEVNGIPYALRGYQGDIDGFKEQPYTGMNYEERKRTTIAKRGQKVKLPAVSETDSLYMHIKDNVWTATEVIDSLGEASVLRAAIKPPGKWNDYRIVAKGNRLQHFINGVLMSDITDNDVSRRKSEGLLGVQVHVGPPMEVAFRNFRLKKLNGAFN